MQAAFVAGGHAAAAQACFAEALVCLVVAGHPACDFAVAGFGYLAVDPRCGS